MFNCVQAFERQSHTESISPHLMWAAPRIEWGDFVESVMDTQIPYGYCQCGCGQKTTIHKGVPRHFIHGHQSVRDPIKHFWKSIDIKDADSCWNWKRALTSAGYGHFSVKGKLTLAHRFSYELAYGNIPAKLEVLHSCDNPRCVNPRHLSLGTHLDNMKDMVKKGRAHKTGANGETNGSAKLTEPQAHMILELSSKGLNATEISKQMDISFSLAYCVVSGKTWSHLRKL